MISLRCRQRALRSFTTACSQDPSSSLKKLPSHARVVVIGGGVIGSSVAYHLTKMGWRDTVVVERNKMTSGTTWHAAGLMVTFGSMSSTSTSFRLYSRELYRRLEEETGQSTGFSPVGFIELATDRHRLEEFRRIADFNRTCGVEVEEIGARDVEKMFPLCRVDDVLGAFYVPGDGRVNPVDVTMALNKGTRMQGGQIFEDTAVTRVIVEEGAVKGVVTSRGTIRCEHVVNCCGMWSRQVGAASEVSIPLQAAEHYYVITDAMPEVQSSWPVIEDPASYTYIRKEGAGLMIGLFEGRAASWKEHGIPEDFAFGEIEADEERIFPFLSKAMERVPKAMDVGIKKVFCGPESFTPDMSPIVGPVPELSNYWVGAGMNSIGILTGGGVGRLLAQWIVSGSPDEDVTGIRPSRFSPLLCEPSLLARRAEEALSMVYACHFPFKQFKSARNLLHSPLHARMQEQGAHFCSMSGVESPDWFGEPGSIPVAGEPTWGFPEWFGRWREEHKACRERVVIMDTSYTSKFRIQGEHAGSFLSRLSTARVIEEEAGRAISTLWLSKEGGMEAIVVLLKLASDDFILLVPDGLHRHAESWMRQQKDPLERVSILDVSDRYAQLAIQGPRARALLERVVGAASIQAANFPTSSVREVEIEQVRVLCSRTSLTGELGYELLIPSGEAIRVYDTIVREGRQLGVAHAGVKALTSLRMEKGWRALGHELDNTDSVLEAGFLSWCALDKPGGFLGRNAVLEKLLEEERKGRRRRMLHVLVLDPSVMLYHGEPLINKGTTVATIRSASYGHTLGGAVGLAMVEAGEQIEDEGWEVQVAGMRHPVRVSSSCFYDAEDGKMEV